jgi:excisionase family DNA binding protein
MSEPRKILREADSRMLVQLTVEEMRGLIEQVVEQKLKRIGGRNNGLLTVEQAAEFLGYSKDWVFKNWKKVGGRKIGGRGVRFDPADLEAWVKSRG